MPGVQLDVGQADELGAGPFGERQALALGAGLDVGAADGVVEHDFLPHAVVDGLAVLHVGAEAAGGDDNGLGVHGHLVGAVVEGLHAHHVARLVGDELGGLHVVQKRDLVGVVADELLERADVGVARRGGRVVAALAEGAGGAVALVLELHAQALQPVDGIQGIVGQVVHQLRGALLVAALDGGVVEGLDGVLDALLALALRVHGVQRALGHVGGAAGDAALLQHDDVRAGLHGRDGRGQARTAAAHDAHVGVVGGFDGRLLGSRGLFQRLEGPGLLGAFLQALLQRHGGQGSAGHGVDVDGLVVHDLIGEGLQGIGAHAQGLLVARGVDGGDGVVGEGDRDGVGRVVAGDLGGVGAGFPAAALGACVRSAAG